VAESLLRRGWRRALDHVGGQGLFTLCFVTAVVAFTWRYRHADVGFCLIITAVAYLFWYSQSRRDREKQQRRQRAYGLVDELQQRKCVTAEQADQIRQGLRDA
jgi:membrane protein implicated in regulation of membrane protease activity